MATVCGDGGLQLRAVAPVLFGVRACEAAKGGGKLRAAARGRTDRHGVPRAGVRPRQRLATGSGELDQAGDKQFAVEDAHTG